MIFSTRVFPRERTLAEAPVLEVRQLEVLFPQGSGSSLRIVRGLDFALLPGKTLGIVGESGSGKTMTALALMSLVPEPGRVQGEIRLQQRVISGLKEPDYEKIRGAALSIVFQDPSTSLNPVMTIGRQMVETIIQHQHLTRSQAEVVAVERLKQVELPDPRKRMDDYPHQLSGGMKQRVLIAMALACEPACVIMDEPTTALDVTVQSQLLDLIENVQVQTGSAIILITHDMGIVAEVADDIAIMYAGQFVEKGTLTEVLHSPRHPYTNGLLRSIPKGGDYKQPLSTIAGLPPSPLRLPTGCPFHPRCPRAIARCRIQEPVLEPQGSQLVACWNVESVL